MACVIAAPRPAREAVSLIRSSPRMVLNGDANGLVTDREASLAFAPALTVNRI